MHGEVDRSISVSLCERSKIPIHAGFEKACKFVDAVGRNEWFVDNEHDDDEIGGYDEAKTIRDADTYLREQVNSGVRRAYEANMTALANCVSEDERVDGLSNLSLTMVAQSPFGDDTHADDDLSGHADDIITADSDLGLRQYDSIGEHAASGLANCPAAGNVPGNMHGEQDDNNSTNGGATTAADSGYHSQDQAYGSGDCETRRADISRVARGMFAAGHISLLLGSC
ncbi:hypothetical protein LTR78_010334 [Recurvomyces mirabilis]|uniref:Uncharacterized protein n=1 Tax=Recurvomyces mirabilis TaxID=574656 RepID=A0AAE0TPV8_9PEZI|nr:hypothetical protein LTR78_010334 [Recurvomyces mirabilis]KAK5156225.1 hypothetical protein LTS14_005112 [Recurvomyces mirabilis]